MRMHSSVDALFPVDTLHYAFVCGLAWQLLPLHFAHFGATSWSTCDSVLCNNFASYSTTSYDLDMGCHIGALRVLVYKVAGRA